MSKEPYTVIAMNVREEFTKRAEGRTDAGTAGVTNIFKNTIHRKFDDHINHYEPTGETYCFGYTVEGKKIYFNVMEARQVYTPTNGETSWMTRPTVDKVTSDMILAKAIELKMVEDADGSDEIMMYVSELRLGNFK